MDEICVRLVARLTKWRLGLGSHREVSFAETVLPRVQLEMLFILQALVMTRRPVFGCSLSAT